MAIVPATTEGSLVKFDMVDSAESLVRILGSQRDLFHSQIDQLQNLVVTQCKLTGVNPLSQEMAAGALSVKIGKKPRDTLNPKAMKYMQSIFSIKDTIGKKETREISALCGITATQVREYLAGQRSRVRKLVKLAQEKATKSVAPKASDNGGTVSLDQSLPATKEAHIESVDHKTAEECKQVPVNCTDINTTDLNMEKCKQIPVNSTSLNTGQCFQLPGNCMILNTRQFIQLPVNSINMYTGVSVNIGDCAQVPGSSGTPNGVQVINQIAVRPTDPKTVKASPIPPVQEEKIPGIESDEKKFLENIFNLMRKEGTFSGQVKLMEWVLQISNPAALNWFVTKDGLAILTKWLREAAFEEQTSVLFVIFKVLCHLPLHKASPVQMSAILQTVNRLRFYRTSGISNRARVLLSRWSKLFVRSQALKKPSVSNPKDAHKELFPKQRISDIIRDESGQPKIDFPAEILALDEGIESDRKPESQKQLKLLSVSCDESCKKRGLSVSTIKTRERRKVQLVEQPGRKAVGRTIQVARPAPSNHSRPMSADDIQKAKMRGMFMQDKYGKPEASTSEVHPLKTEDQRPSPALKASHRLAAASKTVPPQPPNLNEGNMKDEPPSKQEALINSKPDSAHGDQLWEKLKRGQRQWRIPPEMKINSEWSVGNGENSKEVQAQAQRIRREKEIIYPDRHLIPPNSKDPWDTEMDFDDSLTPQIPTEQPPETDAITETRPSVDMDTAGDIPASTSAASQPDLELLAVLLKNPDLVFALTSGQGKNVSEDTVKLLDMLKMSGVGLNGLLQNGVIDSGSKEKPKEPEPPPPVSLPSPTPPSEGTRNGWRSEFTHPTKPPVLQAYLPCSEIASPHPAMGFHTPAPSPPLVNLRCLPAQSPALATVLSLPQLTAIVNSVQPRFHSSSAPSPALFHTPLIPMYPLREPLVQNTANFDPHYELHTPVHPTTPNDFRPFDSRAGGGFIRRGLPPNSRFPANQNYEQQHQQPFVPMGRHEISQVGTWSPEQSPARSPELRPGWNFPGRDAGREFTRQWGYDNLDRDRDRDRDRFWPGGGRRRRDRDRDRDWDRRR